MKLGVLRLRPVLAGLVLVAIGGAAALARPSVVERWSIYASATGGPPASYTFFLGPFPTAASCEVEARMIVRNGGYAQCRGSRRVELGTREQDRLWSQFFPSARWLALCQGTSRAATPGPPAGRKADVAPELRPIPVGPNAR